MAGQSSFDAFHPKAIAKGLGEFFNLRKNFYKVSPMTWFFFLAIVLVIVGLIIPYIILIWIGLFIIGIYLLYLIMWIVNP
jgi:hypothetical protein